MTHRDHEQQPAIEAQGLAKTYGALRVLDGVDLTVPRGTVRSTPSRTRSAPYVLARPCASIAGCCSWSRWVMGALSVGFTTVRFTTVRFTTVRFTTVRLGAVRTVYCVCAYTVNAVSGQAQGTIRRGPKDLHCRG